MRCRNKFGKEGKFIEERDGKTAGEGLSPEEGAELDEALRDFRLSIHAWSEAAYSRPRTAVAPVRKKSWRLAAGCALGCVLVAAGVSGGVYSHIYWRQAVGWEHPRQETSIVASRAVEPQRPVVKQPGQRVSEEEESLLAKVDSDVSREVPRAMEPLAQMMAVDEAQ